MFRDIKIITLLLMFCITLADPLGAENDLELCSSCAQVTLNCLDSESLFTCGILGLIVGSIWGISDYSANRKRKSRNKERQEQEFLLGLYAYMELQRLDQQQQTLQTEPLEARAESLRTQGTFHTPSATGGVQGPTTSIYFQPVTFINSQKYKGQTALSMRFEYSIPVEW